MITVDHMKKMRDQAIVCNIGHFDSEIEGRRCVNTSGKHRRQVDQISSSRTANASSCWPKASGEPAMRTGHPSFVMSNLFTNQTLAQIELFTRGDSARTMYVLPKHLDEKWHRLHLQRIGANLTRLSDEQATYLSMSKDGP